MHTILSAKLSRRISYTGDAFAALLDVVNFVESRNTQGAGIRWLNKFEKFLTEAVSNPTIIKLCNILTFQELDLRCVNFNDWVITFSISGDDILIEAILHSSRLTD